MDLPQAMPLRYPEEQMAMTSDRSDKRSGGGTMKVAMKGMRDTTMKILGQMLAVARAVETGMASKTRRRRNGRRHVFPLVSVHRVDICQSVNVGV
jgi:hypothetical protein